MKKKKIFLDVVFNLVANVIPIAVLQLFVLPNVSKLLGDEKYGFIVTIVALMNLVPATIGNALNNIRLIRQKDCKDGERNDFQLLFLISSICNIVSVFILSIFYSSSFDIITILLILLMSILWLCHEYYVVSYRIALNFLFILLDNVCLSAGFLLGFLLLKYCSMPWQFVFVVGYGLSFLFIFFTSKLMRERVSKTCLFKAIGLDFLILLIANFISRAVGYVDRLILYPILGGHSVSVYYSASIFSKIMGLAVTPLTSVLLSYLSKMENVKKKVFIYSIIIASVFSLVACVCSILLARPLLGYLYPEYVDEAIAFVPILSVAMFFSTIVSVINPFVLKFCKMKWQIIMNLIILVFYVSVCLILLTQYGLIGFCVGTAVTYALKMIIQIVVYRLFSAKKNSQLVEETAPNEKLKV